jgi:hypothetical protein
MLTLATRFVDDGSRFSKGVQLSTQCFTYQRCTHIWKHVLMVAGMTWDTGQHCPADRQVGHAHGRGEGPPEEADHGRHCQAPDPCLQHH